MKQKLENKIICIALLSNNQFDKLALIFEKIKENMLSPNNKIIFNQIKDNFEKGEVTEVDTININQDYLFEILETEVLTTNLEKNIKDYLEEHNKNQLRINLKQAHTMLENEEISTVKNFMNVKLNSIDTTEKMLMHNTAEITKELFDEAEGTQEVLDSGFKALGDKVIYNRGDMIVIGARPGMGKTAFILNKAINLLKQKKNVVIISCEMGRKQLIKRMIANIGQLPLHRIKNLKSLKYFNKDENFAWSNSIEKLNQFTNLRIIDTNGDNKITTLQSQIVKAEKELGGIDFIMLDYAQLVSTGRALSRYEEVTNVSLWCKQIARQFDCVSIILSQLSRAVEQRTNKRPMLSDLRESGQLEQDASVIQFLYRDEYYNEDTEHKGIIEVITAKNRDGVCDTEYMQFVGETQSIF